MTQEEKAKRYDESLSRDKNLHKDAIDMGENIRAKQCEIISPELKESEDERIRKEIIEMLRNWASVHYITKEQFSERMAWLEKQGEQNEKIVEFKASDWYVSKVDGKIYNAKFVEESHTNQKRRLEIEKAAFSATGIIEQSEWFIAGAKWADEHPNKELKRLIRKAESYDKLISKGFVNIEKVCNWLDNNAEDYTIDGGLSIENLIYSFKKKISI